MSKINTTTIKTNHPILDVVSNDVELFETREDIEYRGPCPFCQTGTDRFGVWPNGAGVGKFFCRTCERRGDVIDYIRQRHNLSFIEAVRFLDGQPAQTSPEKRLQPLSRPELSGNDLVEWQNKLEVMTQRAMTCLLEDETAAGARQWLAGRGIGWEQITYFGLGYNPHWREIIPGYKLPPGILLPRWDNDIVITGVNVYLAKDARDLFGSKRAWVKGSKPKAALFNGWRISTDVETETAETVLIFEGELDASLTQRFYSPQDNQATITTATGGSDCLPDDITSLQGKRVIIVLDNDIAGAKFANAWQELLPGCQLLNVPDGKDVTDYWKGGGDVAQLLNGVINHV